MNEDFDLEAKRQQQQDLLNEMEDAKTDKHELAEVLEEYEFDHRILTEFNAVTQEFQHLKQDFLALKRTNQLRLSPNG